MKYWLRKKKRLNLQGDCEIAFCWIFHSKGNEIDKYSLWVRGAIILQLETKSNRKYVLVINETLNQPQRTAKVISILVCVNSPLACSAEWIIDSSSTSNVRSIASVVTTISYGWRLGAKKLCQNSQGDRETLQQNFVLEFCLFSLYYPTIPNCYTAACPSQIWQATEQSK